ncbi:MAG: response regulator transcription factor [Synergistaceae bacterium]|jgi:YesN/AraC family two-component response regulator|nr:response regulator transcription factor [Synergistaceae bacterium]
MFKVVVADDEYLEREVIKQTVRQIEGTVIAGESNCGGLAAVICATVKPDLAFLNCGMGALGGMEAADVIRRSDKNIVIILTSADENNFTDRDSAKQIARLDIAECLLKPARTEKIREVVLRYHEHSGSASGVSPKMKKQLRFYPDHLMSHEIRHALSFIGDHYKENIRLKFIADRVNLSSYYFSRLFKKEVGVNLSQYILHKRLEIAKQMLEETDQSIVDISASVGFQEHNYFGKIFKRFTGATPSEYRKKHAIQQEERKDIRGKYL